MANEKEKAFWPLVVSTWGKREEGAACKQLRHGNVTQGAAVAAYEKAFAASVRARYAVAVNSGSSANLLAIATLMCTSNNNGGTLLQQGDEAIVPAIAWSTTYSPLHYLGIKLRVVDVEYDSFGIDTDQLEKAITKKTKLLLGVSILGFPAALHKMRAFALDHNLLFMEDNCESYGATLCGNFCGTFGDIGTFSTFFSHHLNTIEGGVMVTNNTEFYNTAKSVRAHGLDRDNLSREVNVAFPDQYNFVEPGFNLRTTDVQAAIGLIQLQRAAHFNEIRRSNYALFKNMIAEFSDIKTQNEIPLSHAVPYGFVLVHQNKKRLIEHLRNERIEHRLVTGGCFTRHPYSKKIDHVVVGGQLPVAEEIHDNGLFVSNQAYDLEPQIRKLRSILKKPYY